MNKREAESVSLNFFEWLFLRKMAVAWNFSVGVDGFITKDELLGIAMQIVMP
jgi:hypothetical protein